MDINQLNTAYAEQYRKTHEGFSTIIDKAAPKKRCEPICKPSVCDCIRAKPLSDKEIIASNKIICTCDDCLTKQELIAFARLIEERHGIK